MIGTVPIETNTQNSELTIWSIDDSISASLPGPCSARYEISAFACSLVMKKSCSRQIKLVYMSNTRSIVLVVCDEMAAAASCSSKSLDTADRKLSCTLS